MIKLISAITLKSERRSKLLWTCFSALLRIGSGLVILPIALRSIPQQEMGLYYTFLALIGIAPLMDLGMGQTVGRNASYAWAGAKSFSPHGLPDSHVTSTPNFALLWELIDLLKKWYFTLGVLITLIYLTFGSYFIYHKIIDENLKVNLVICWALFVFGTSLNLQTGYWVALVNGIGRFDASSKFLILTQLLWILVMSSGLLLGLGLWTYAISSLISPIPIRYFSKMFFLKTIGKNEHNFESNKWKKHISTLWPMTWRDGIYSASTYITNRGNVFIVTSNLGLYTSGSFGLSQYMITVILQIAVIPLYIIMPEIAMNLVNNNHSKAKKIFIISLYSSLAAAFFGLVLLVIFGGEFLNFIGSKSAFLPLNTLCILCVISIMDFHQDQYCRVVIASNKNPFWLIILITSLVSMTISYHAPRIWGLSGILYTQLICGSLILYWWPVYLGIRTLNSKSSS